MIYKRKNKEESEENDVTEETPVKLPESSVKEEVIKVQKTTIEQGDNFTHSSFGMFKNVETGLWSLIEIKYDPNNLSVNSKVEITNLEDNDKEYAFERMRILLGDRLFV